RVAVDVLLKLGAGIAQRRSLEKNGRNPGVNHGCLEGADARYFKLINDVAGGEEGTTAVLVVGRGVHELDLNFGGWKGNTIQLEISGFLNGSARHGYV